HRRGSGRGGGGTEERRGERRGRPRSCGPGRPGGAAAHQRVRPSGGQYPCPHAPGAGEGVPPACGALWRPRAGGHAHRPGGPRRGGAGPPGLHAARRLRARGLDLDPPRAGRRVSDAGPRVHVRPEAVSGTRVILDAEEAHHLRRVLRLRVGDLVRALDGRGRELTVRLTALGVRSAEGEILASATPGRESPLHLTLAQGLPKADTLETIIRMSTELGVAAVVPLLTKRTVAAGLGQGRLARWERVAREAAKQGGRVVVPA